MAVPRVPDRSPPKHGSVAAAIDALERRRKAPAGRSTPKKRRDELDLDSIR